MKLNKNNYYSTEANKEYMSVSQFKSFLSCEAKTMAKLQGEWKEQPNDAFLVGSYVHSWSEGKLEEFRHEHPELFKKDGTLYQKYEIGERMVRALTNDEIVNKVREGQKEVIVTAEVFGTPWKAMFDIYNPDLKTIVDLKTTREIFKKYKNDNTGELENFIKHYDYLLQMAVYCEIDRINRNADDYFYPHIIAVSKEATPDKAVIFLGTDFIQDKLLEIEIKLERILQVKNGLVEPERCNKCDYCRSTKKIDRILHYMEI